MIVFYLPLQELYPPVVVIGLSLVPVAGGVVVVVSPHKLVVVDCIELVGNFVEIHIQENCFLKKKLF